MPDDDPDRLDTLFHALADSTRRTILEELIQREEQTLFEICVRLVQGHRLALTRQAISKHLTVLENAGLIRSQWKGRSKTHSCQLEKLRPTIDQWLSRIDPVHQRNLR